MKKFHLISLCGALLLSGWVPGVFAQDLTITNVRIIVTNDAVVDQGSIVVRGGRIVSAAPGAPPTSSTAAGQTIDARGMTAIAGFIDAHRHVNTGPNEKAQMQALLDAGYTTILSGGGPAEGNITLRDHIEKGVINGPRIIPSGRLNLQTSTPDAIRAEVRRLAALGDQVHRRAEPDAETRADGEGDGESSRRRRRVKESQRLDSDSRRQPAVDDGGGRCGRGEARPHAALRLGES